MQIFKKQKKHKKKIKKNKIKIQKNYIRLLDTHTCYPFAVWISYLNCIIITCCHMKTKTRLHIFHSFIHSFAEYLLLYPLKTSNPISNQSFCQQHTIIIFHCKNFIWIQQILLCFDGGNTYLKLFSLQRSYLCLGRQNNSLFVLTIAAAAATATATAKATTAKQNNSIKWFITNRKTETSNNSK